ncbi:uncharacterized protein LOC144132400 [Amblyomma americanum]
MNGRAGISTFSLPVMSFSGLTPPPPFLPVPGRPAVPWSQWVRLFKNYMLASGASDFSAERRKALLIHSLGVEGQRTFTLPGSAKDAKEGESATAKDLPADSEGASTRLLPKQTETAPSPYDDAVTALGNHFNTRTNIVVERHRFRKRVQQPGESINEYVVALREHAAACSFAVLEDALRDQFLTGISSQHVRERLLLDGSSLSFSRAVLVATQLEQTTQDVQAFASTSVQHVATKNNAPFHCFRCGSNQHSAASFHCPAKGKRCHCCGRVGHFKSVCNKDRRVASVRELSSEERSDVANILVVAASTHPGIHIDVLVGNTSVAFLVDSGSAVSIMSYSLFNQHFSSKAHCTAPLVKLLDYSRQPIPVHGCFLSEVTYMARTASILFYVLYWGTSLLGIDAIRALNLRIEGSSLCCLETIATAAGSQEQCSVKETQPCYAGLPSYLRKEFHCLFGEGIGLARTFVHQVKTRPSFQPTASKLRRLPL